MKGINVVGNDVGRSPISVRCIGMTVCSAIGIPEIDVNIGPVRASARGFFD